MQIGVIGCGTIASAVVHGIAGDRHQITLSQRSSRFTAPLAAAYDNVQIADNQGVIDASDVVFLGLMSDIASAVLDTLTFRKDQRIITFMAGATLAEVDAMVRPARATAIMMPFPGIAQGGTPIMMQGDTELVGQIFGGRNSIFPVNEAGEMDAYLCAQAVLSPVARMVADAADWLGERVADKPQAEAFLRTLIASNLSNMPCETLIEALNTPQGYNQRLRLHMEDSGMGNTLKAGLDKMAD